MRTNSFSANSIGGRGGLFDSGAQAIKDALLAYFQSKRNERQDQRQLKRDERINERDQTNQAVELARRTGVRPDASQLGWTSPDRINPLLDASVRQHTQSQERQAQERQMQDAGRRVALLRAAAEHGPGAVPEGAWTPDMQAAYDRTLAERAMTLKRQGVTDQLNNVRLKQEQDQAVYDSVPGRAVRGIGQWLGDMGQEAVRAAGRQKQQPVPGMNSAQIMLRDLSLAEQTGQPYMGENNTVVPVEKIPAFRAALQQWVAQQGGQVPQQSGVDINGPTATSGGVPEEISVAAAANALPAPSADVLQRNVLADYDSVNRRGSTGAVTPQEVRAVAERARMRKGIPTQHAQANIRPTDTEAEIVAAYISVHGGTPVAARAALQAAGVLQ